MKCLGQKGEATLHLEPVHFLGFSSISPSVRRCPRPGVASGSPDQRWAGRARSAR